MDSEINTSSSQRDKRTGWPPITLPVTASPLFPDPYVWQHREVGHPGPRSITSVVLQLTWPSEPLGLPVPTSPGPFVDPWIRVFWSLGIKNFYRGRKCPPGCYTYFQDLLYFTIVGTDSRKKCLPTMGGSRDRRRRRTTPRQPIENPSRCMGQYSVVRGVTFMHLYALRESTLSCVKTRLRI